MQRACAEAGEAFLQSARHGAPCIACTPANEVPRPRTLWQTRIHGLSSGRFTRTLASALTPLNTVASANLIDISTGA
jgi:hypothetical protein